MRCYDCGKPFCLECVGHDWIGVCSDYEEVLEDEEPSTVYQYARLMKNVYLDIEFEDGIFYTIQDEKIEQLSGQRRLKEQLA